MIPQLQYPRMARVANQITKIAVIVAKVMLEIFLMFFIAIEGFVVTPIYQRLFKNLSAFLHFFFPDAVD